MPQESRVKKSLLNARVNLIFYFLTLALSFFSRKIFLDTLGADFIGFTSTISNILAYLNLAELGIGSAIGYVLYKPLFDHDQQRINEIVSVMGYLYKWVGSIILVGGCILACFLPLIFPSTGFNTSLIFFAYFSFLVSSLLGYFCNYKQTLLGADQRNYVVTSYFQGCNIIKTIIQIILVYYTANYYLWVAIELSFGILFSLILNIRIRQVYPWLHTETKQGPLLLKKYPEINKYVKQLFIQKISGTVQWWTIPILTYAFTTLSTVAFYGNYTIITDKLSQLVNTFLESTSAGVGNLIAEGNTKRIESIFWQLISLRYFVGFNICFDIYMLINPFICLWLGAEYLLSNIVVLLLCISCLISFTRGGIMQFVYGYGLFYDIWASIVEVVINLSVACIGGYFWGLPGVLLGGITSQTIIIMLWKPYFLFKQGFHRPPLDYWKKLSKIVISLSVPAFIIYIINSEVHIPTSSVIDWIIYAFIIFICYVLSSLTCLLISISEFRIFLKTIIVKHNK